MKIHPFHERTMPILGEEGLSRLESVTVTSLGLGGNGGPAFMQLVRMGIKKWRIAEPGIYDSPDMNRQIFAFESTLGTPKIDMFEKYAREINPDIEIEAYPEGLTVDNIHKLLNGADVIIRALDPQCCKEVKKMFPELLKQYNIPMFLSVAKWTTAIVHCYHPKGEYTAHNFIKMIVSKYVEYFKDIEEQHTNYRKNEGDYVSCSVGNMLAATLMATEVLVYLLQGLPWVKRKPVFVPNYIFIDPFGHIEIQDIREPYDEFRTNNK